MNCILVLKNVKESDLILSFFLVSLIQYETRLPRPKKYFKGLLNRIETTDNIRRGSE